MALFSCSASCTSRTVEGPRVQRTRSISSSDAVGFCGGCFMEEDHTTKIFVVSTKIFVGCEVFAGNERTVQNGYKGGKWISSGVRVISQFQASHSARAAVF